MCIPEIGAREITSCWISAGALEDVVESSRPRCQRSTGKLAACSRCRRGSGFARSVAQTATLAGPSASTSSPRPFVEGVAVASHPGGRAQTSRRGGVDLELHPRGAVNAIAWFSMILREKLLRAPWRSPAKYSYAAPRDPQRPGRRPSGARTQTSASPPASPISCPRGTAGEAPRRSLSLPPSTLAGGGRGSRRGTRRAVCDGAPGPLLF